MAEGDPRGAAIAFALAARLREEIGCPRPGYLRSRCAAAQAHLAVGSDGGVAAWTAGWDVARVVDHVLAASSSGEVGCAETLTGREREVAALVAGGATNAEVGAALTISARTAERHLENVRRKLGVHSRAQVAAWVASCARDG